MKNGKQYSVKIKSIEKITHDVLQIVTDKPLHYLYKPGQATEVSINKSGWHDEKRPFTFTSVPNKDYLEFTIKTYPAHQSVTYQLLQLKKADELFLHDVFGAIEYKSEGIFIAGGAGVTPFISILRELQSKNELGNNKLIFANKARVDIILEEEFKKMLGSNFINILSDQTLPGYASGQISEDFIKKHAVNLDQYFYVCGPPPMMSAVEKQLKQLGVVEKYIVKEEF
ncbi:MAG: flavodoxin reductase [Bacteroidia bacterium]|nr:flavodoxin reductase [Bacteroidia bacterium]